MNRTDRCDECLRLASEVEGVLQQLLELTTAQLDAFLAKDNAKTMRLDKQLEHAVGRKERASGAQRHHAREHGKVLYDDREKESSS